MNNAITENVPSAWYSTLENFIVKGKNAEIWDSDGNRFLDFVGGYAVLNTGHLHPVSLLRRMKGGVEHMKAIQKTQTS